MLGPIMLSDVFCAVDLNIHATNGVDRETLKDRLVVSIIRVCPVLVHGRLLF